MEDILTWACMHAEDAYWMVFVLLFLAGLNIPISEDIVLITAGALANTCLDGNTIILFICCYLAAWMSAWEVYWIGRLFGPKLYNIPWLNKMVNKEKIDTLHVYYEKYGIFTFMIGRFIPGGFRNALFITAGMGRMPFLKFISRDGPACLLSTTTLFSIGYLFAEYHQNLVEFIKRYNLVGLLIILSLIGGVILWKRYKKPA